jgi:phosphatidylglycerol:prolipoprotein diacylglycerol transferase
MITATTGIIFPNLDPIAFQIGFVAVKWYSLAYLFGIIFGWLYILHLNKKFLQYHVDIKALDNLPLWAVIGIIFGGRIGYVLFYNFEYYENNLYEALMIWHGGMSFHGGLIGAIAAFYLFSKYYGIKPYKVLDLCAAATPIGLFLGRIANFINAELYGRITDVSWGVVFPGEFYARHPSQLYEAALEGFVLFFILLFFIKRANILSREGAVSGLFIMFYGIFRFIVEYFREPDSQIGYIMDHFTMGQILCLPMIIFGFYLLFIRRVR